MTYMDMASMQSLTACSCAVVDCRPFDLDQMVHNKGHSDFFFKSEVLVNKF
jgi:hypothetical protein